MMSERTKNFRYTATNVKSYATKQGGNYIIRVKLKDGTLKVVYVGRTKNLQKRLLDHLSDSESNNCIKKHVTKYILYFRYCHVGTVTARSNTERSLYNKYSPECNHDPPT